MRISDWSSDVCSSDLLLGLGGGIDAGGDHGNPHAAFHVPVERRADDDVGLGVDFLADAVGRLVDLEQGQVGAAGDVDQHAAGALHRDKIGRASCRERVCQYV